MAESMADKKRVKSMEAALEGKRKVYDAASEKASKVEAKVQKVHSKIMELTEGKMNKAREKLDAVTAQITKVGINLHSMIFAKMNLSSLVMFLGEH